MKDIYKKFEQDRFAKLCGMSIEKIEKGFAQTSMTVEQKHLNGINVCQGGAIFTLADLALACAANSYGPVAVSLNMSSVFLEAAYEKQKLTAQAREISLHKRIAVYEIEVKSDDNRLIAKMTGTVYRKQNN